MAQSSAILLGKFVHEFVCMTSSVSGIRELQILIVATLWIINIVTLRPRA